MSESSLTACIAAFRDPIRLHVLAPIMALCHEKGCQVTMEEMEARINLPVSSVARPALANPFGGAAPSMTASVAPTSTARSRAAANVSEVHMPGMCCYQYQRGVNKGKYCNKACAPGQDKCNACSKTRSTKPAAAKPGVAPTIGALGVPGMNMGMAPGPVDQATDSSPLDAEDYDPARGLFRLKGQPFVVKEVGEEVVVVGCHDPITNSLRTEITDQEKVAAAALNLILYDQGAAAVQQQQVAPVMPNIAPLVGQVPVMPQMPQVAAQVPQVTAQMPQLQAVSQMPQAQPIMPQAQPTMPQAQPTMPQAQPTLSNIQLPTMGQ